MTSSVYTTSAYKKLMAVFGPDIPIVEATTALRATCMPLHAKGSKEKNGLCCVLAKMLGTDVAVLRCKTYILSTDKGAKVLVKYANGASAEAFIKMFDEGMRPTRPIEVEFLPIPATHTRAHLQARHQRKVEYKTAHGHEPPRAYRKPTVRTMTFAVVKGVQRTLVEDRAHRCAVRYNTLGATA